MIALVRGVIAAIAAAGVDVERAGLGVDEHGRRADTRDATGGGEERIGRRDHFVAGADVERHQRGEHRVGAR